MNQIIDVSIGRFDVLNKNPTQWIMYFNIGYDLNVNDYLTVKEINSLHIYTGRQITSLATSKYNSPIQFTNQSIFQINLLKIGLGNMIIGKTFLIL